MVFAGVEILIVKALFKWVYVSLADVVVFVWHSNCSNGVRGTVYGVSVRG